MRRFPVPRLELTATFAIKQVHFSHPEARHYVLDQQKLVSCFGLAGMEYLFFTPQWHTVCGSRLAF